MLHELVTAVEAQRLSQFRGLISIHHGAENNRAEKPPTVTVMCVSQACEACSSDARTEKHSPVHIMIPRGAKSMIIIAPQIGRDSNQLSASQSASPSLCMCVCCHDYHCRQC